MTLSPTTLAPTTLAPSTDDELIDRVRSRLADTPHTITAADIADAVRAESGGIIADTQLLKILRIMRDELSGAGVLDPLLRLPGVTDVLVTAPDHVWIDRGHGLELTDVTFRDDAAVRRLAVRLASACGRRLDDAQPFFDGHMPTKRTGNAAHHTGSSTARNSGSAGHSSATSAGVRVHAMLAPPAAEHTLISLRTLHSATMSLDELIARGTVADDAGQLLRKIIQRRLSFIVAGGTGSGKTTLLASLLAEVSPDERLLIVEDTPELAPVHPHVVSLVSKPANIEGAGEITQRDLLRQALRMRPDRVIVGEIRGAEVVDLLAAMNTGHDGGAGTIHANTAEDIPARFEALGALGGLSRTAVHAQLRPAIRVVLSVSKLRAPDGTTHRRLVSIGILHGNPVRVTPAWTLHDGPTTAMPELLTLLQDGDPTNSAEEREQP